MKGKYKKSNIYFDDTPTLQSLNAVTSDGIAKAINEGAGGDYTQLRHDVDNIQAVIPSNATTSNKLATSSDIPDTSTFASATDLTAVSGRVTTAENDIDNIQAVIPSNATTSNKLATSSDIPDTSTFASATDLTAVSGRVTTAENDIDNIQAVIPSNATTSNKLATSSDIPDTSTFASATDLTAVSGRVTTAENDIDNIQAVIPSNATTSNKLATLADVSGGGGVTIKSETHIVPFSQSGLGYVSFDYTTKCLLSVYSNTSNKIVGVHSMGANYASSQYNIPIGSFIRLQGADTSDGSMGTITGNVSITILYLDK